MNVEVIQEWQSLIHPYPTLIKTRGIRVLPGLVSGTAKIEDEIVKLSDLFEARKKKPVQLKRCVRAVAKQYGGDVSKAFAICTAQLQKGGYLKVGTQEPTKVGKKVGRSKAAEKGHSDKVSEYEKMLDVARKGE